ncbi:F-box-like domain containing protein [Ceratobasidium theobromae]|uniref:F-box-like domain containing protein n=1 Tax=Ceratobasidium theobromae TaxID=1582974 RepID=A0A5N5QDF7_9AGAM|nr:F-box-like domain containing protein [Ceratobasidium theobromae]
MTMEELIASSDLLNIAIDRYLCACTTFKTRCVQENVASTPYNIPRRFSERLAQELQRITSYATKINLAKVAIGRVNDLSVSVVPIHALPAEVLAYIFKLVCDMQPSPCIASGRGVKRIIPPTYPDLFSYVCSRWRQIAISSRILWAHIDLVGHHLLNQGLLARAEMHVSRAGQLPLDIHILDPDPHSHPLEDIDPTSLTRFITSIGTRIRSLELHSRDRSDAFHQDVLSGCFASCTAGIFTQLTLWKEGEESWESFMITANSDTNQVSHLGSAFPLNVSQQRLEDVWLHISVLRLNRFFFGWESNAYRGVTELRPVSPVVTIIPELQLVAILKSSPRLRVFQFGLLCQEQLSAGTLVEPVGFTDLEVLDLSEMVCLHWPILRWFAPGSKPLEYGTGCHNILELQLSNISEYTEFFARSNITKLRVRGAEYPALSNLVNYFPQVRSVVLTCSLFMPGTGRLGDLVLGLQLDSLYVLESEIDLKALGWFVEEHPTQRLVFWDCTFHRSDLHITDEQDIRNDLSRICTVIEFFDGNEPNPISDWD